MYVFVTSINLLSVPINLIVSLVFSNTTWKPSPSCKSLILISVSSGILSLEFNDADALKTLNLVFSVNAGQIYVGTGYREMAESTNELTEFFSGLVK